MPTSGASTFYDQLPVQHSHLALEIVLAGFLGVNSNETVCPVGSLALWLKSGNSTISEHEAVSCRLKFRRTG